MEKILEVNQLTTQYLLNGEWITAVDDVSFTLIKGETLGIVGESGSGKSTVALSVIRLISTLQGKITSGDILYCQGENKVDLLKISSENMRLLRGKSISMIFQEPMTALNPVLTCGFQVAEVIKLHYKVSMEEATNQSLYLFEKVELPRVKEIYHSYPHQLSGGQKQRVMITMAIAGNPSILIADELTTALDALVQRSILKLLKKLQKESGMSMIIISHDLAMISEVSDRVIVMQKGKKVEDNKVINIFHSPQHPYTKSLIASRVLNNQSSPKLSQMDNFPADAELKMPVQGRVIDILENLPIQEPLLSVCNLNVTYAAEKKLFDRNSNKVKAVDGVSFDLYYGETLGIVGASGCGKTTLTRTILGLNNSLSGEVFFKGQDLMKLDFDSMRKMRKYIQVVFQDPYSALNPKLSVGNAIMEPMEVNRLYVTRKLRKEKVVELLHSVGLGEHYFSRFPNELSAGERQRICIARALAVEPELIICDEAVSALDVTVQAQVLNLLNELKTKKNLTYIFISHDLSVVRHMSDRIMIMDDGKVEEIGTTKEIFNYPKSAVTQKFIASLPTI